MHGAVAADLEILPFNRDVVELFIALSTQWRYTFSGRLSGMDYQSAGSTMDMMGYTQEQRSALFEGLQIMEGAVLKAQYND